MIGDKLKRLRKAKGLSLKDLSEKTNGISVSFLSDIENGRSNPSLDKLKLISDALETPTSYFVDNAEEGSLNSIVNDVELLPVIDLLRDFSQWDLEDKKELLYYLKAKKVLRNK